ncbi:MAG: hypothetical protein WBA88_12340 [Pseudaminobacter sp.]
MKSEKFLSSTRCSGRKWVKSAAILIAASIGFAAHAHADDRPTPKEQTRSVYLVKYRVDNEVRYTKNPARKVIKVSASQYRASNPYVCTPSGFGQKARCYIPGIFKLPNV